MDFPNFGTVSLTNLDPASPSQRRVTLEILRFFRRSNFWGYSPSKCPVWRFLMGGWSDHHVSKPWDDPYQVVDWQYLALPIHPERCLDGIDFSTELSNHWWWFIGHIFGLILSAITKKHVKGVSLPMGNSRILDIFWRGKEMTNFHHLKTPAIQKRSAKVFINCLHSKWIPPSKLTWPWKIPPFEDVFPIEKWGYFSNVMLVFILYSDFIRCLVQPHEELKRRHWQRLGAQEVLCWDSHCPEPGRQPCVTKSSRSNRGH